MAISMAIGTSLSGIVYNKLGFYGAYGISSILLIIGLLYGLLCVRDFAPDTEVNKNKSCGTTVSEFFDLKHITDSMYTTFKKRPKTQRLRIIILLITIMISAGTNNGQYYKPILCNMLGTCSNNIIFGLCFFFNQTKKEQYYNFFAFLFRIIYITITNKHFVQIAP